MRIPYSRQKITSKDVSAVTKILKSDFLTQGKTIEIFEKEICKKVKVKYGVAVNSGTSALHIGCLALGLKSNDYLWTVGNSFVASANCGRYCGANIEFVDINPKTFNIDPELLEKKLKNTAKNKIPKILVVVHFTGEPAEMKKIYNLKKKYRFKIIEDASHALGAKIKKDPVGSCKYSDLTVFSFHPVKSITTAEGGIATTNNKEVFIKMQLLRNHGITRNINLFKKKIKSYWYYEQQLLGFNYRMNDLEAALGVSQLKNLDNFIQERRKIDQNYRELLKDLPVDFQTLEKNNQSSHHLFILKLNLKKIKYTYDVIFNKLRKHQLGINLHYLPIYSHPYYKRIKNYKKLKNTEAHYKSAISIPVYPGLKKQQQLKVCKIIKKIIQN